MKTMTNTSSFRDHYPTSVLYTPTTRYCKSSILATSSSGKETVYYKGNTLELVSWSVLYSVLSVIIIIGNALTIVIFRTNVHLCRKKEHCFLLSLAVADILVGIAGIPLQVFLLVQSWSAEKLPQYLILQKVFLATDVFFGLASIFTLNAIALERLYSVMRPQKHRKVKKKTYWFLVRAPWVASALESSLYLLSLLDVLPFDVVFQFITISLLCSMLSMCVAYTTIKMLMKKRERNQSKQTITFTVIRSGLQGNRERKLTILVVIVTGVFLVTWLPFQIMNIVFYICHLNNCDPEVSTTLIRVVKLLQYSNSVINPLIYSFNIKGFRKCMRRKLANSLQQLINCLCCVGSRNTTFLVSSTKLRRQRAIRNRKPKP